MELVSEVSSGEESKVSSRYWFDSSIYMAEPK